MIFNILIAISILLLVLLSSFALYLPLCALTKDKLIGLRYAIPFSISVEIIIGYIFYCTSAVKYFPISYLIIVILANIWGYYRLRPIVIRKPKIDLLKTLSLIVILAAILYTRYFDSFKFVGPGGNDTYSHLLFVKNLLETGYLSNGYYAPGFHLFLMPIAKIIPSYYLYRFTGPAIGIISVIAIVLLIKDYLKNRSLLILLLALLASPIYNQLTLQTISFFSSSLTFIYFASFIFLLSDKSGEQRKIPQYLFFIFCGIALAVTVPYLFVTLIPAFLTVFIIVLIFKSSFEKKYSRYLLQLILILFIGFAFSFGHLFIQSNILKHYAGFPGIPVATEDNGETTLTSNNEVANQYHLPNFISANSFLKPMFGTGIDLIKIKKLRPINSVLGLGAYLWIAFSIYLLVYAIRKKNSALVVVATFSIIFGVHTQTGLFEMSYYRGRSGWYLLLLSILGIVLFLDQVYSSKLSRWFLAACVAISITGFFLPPVFYRSYYDDEFKIASQIVKQFPDTAILLVATNSQLKIVASNISTLDLDPANLGNTNAFLIIDKKMLIPNPVLSQSAISTDSNLDEFNGRYEDKEKKIENINAQIESSEDFKKYKKYYENGDFIVFDNIKDN
ncbi:MAG: hypothetical protein NTZ65_03535 [Candidatus Berkelbacteria bacterium]|nr:hypothetical protein [Candidatus Berkelbacteria bacterium]